MVFTRKAYTGRYRARAVACGNFITDESYDRTEKYSAGVEGIAIRLFLRFCAAKGLISQG